VVRVEDRDARPEVLELRELDVRAGCDDQLVPDLARARGCSVQRAASSAALAVDHVSADPSPRRLVPDLDELERQEPDLLAVLGIELDGALVMQVRAGAAQAVQLRDHDRTSQGELRIIRAAARSRPARTRSKHSRGSATLSAR